MKNKNLLIEDKDYPEYLKRYADAHSQYLIALSERGILGLMSLFLILFLPMILFYIKCFGTNVLKSRNLGISGISVIVIYCVAGLTNSTLEHKYLLMFYLVITSVIFGACYPPKIEHAN